MNSNETIMYNAIRHHADILTDVLNEKEISLEELSMALSEALEILAMVKGNGNNCESCHK